MVFEHDDRKPYEFIVFSPPVVMKSPPVVRKTIYIYIHIYTSVDPNAYTCIHSKTTRSKEPTQQSWTGQHDWLPFCHNFVTIVSGFRSPLRSPEEFVVEVLRTCACAIVLSPCLVGGEGLPGVWRACLSKLGPAWGPVWPALGPV